VHYCFSVVHNILPQICALLSATEFPLTGVVGHFRVSN